MLRTGGKKERNYASIAMAKMATVCVTIYLIWLLKTLVIY